MSLHTNMDITNLLANSLGDRRVKAGQTAASEDANRAAPGQSKTDDQVQLSDQARSLQQAAESVSDQPAFDAERVAAIRQAIAEGRYHVDPERLAEKFMDLENQLIQ